MTNPPCPESEKAIQAAEWYDAATGWRATPLHTVGPDGKTCSCPKGANCGKSAGKHNIAGGWQQDFRGPQIFREMAAKRRRMNIGILTGEPSGIFVLDVDPNGGGMESMKEIIAEHGPLPPTWLVQTGTGGWHFYFKMPDFDMRNSVSKIAPGVDIRANGGMVVTAPSVSWAGPYVIRNQLPPAEAPEWLLERLRPQQAPDPFAEGGWLPAETTMHVEPAQQPVPTTKLTEPTHYEIAAVNGELARVQALPAAGWSVPWDITTFEVACNLIEIANAPWAALTLEGAHQAFLGCCPPEEPGYNPQTKWESALTRVGTKARPAPPPRADDPFADNPDVKGAPPDPTRAAGPDREGVPAAEIFAKDGLQSLNAAQAVIALGPIRKGQNGRWWTWDDRGVWREEQDAVQMRLIRLAQNKYRANHTGTVEQVVGALVPRLMLDEPNADLMNFRNGMLDWRTGQMHPHHPDLLSTIQFPVEYEPDAMCPRFDAFLASVMSPDYVKLAWEMMAYLLYSGNPLQKAFLFHGTGANGKGTLIRVIQAMLGTQNTSSQSLDRLNSSQFAPVALFGKIANLAGDIDATFQESTAMFKMLTGEDRITGEYKYGDSFTFNSWAVPVFSANKIPGSADVTVGYLRRWVVLEFDRTFAGEPILNLSDRLILELPGIVAKALKFLGPLFDRQHFDVAGEASKGAENFAMAVDQVRQWVDEWIVPAPEDQRVLRSTLYARYATWAAANNSGRLKASEFYARLESAGFKQAKIRGERYFTGLFVIEPDRANVGALAGPESTDDFFTP